MRGEYLVVLVVLITTVTSMSIVFASHVGIDDDPMLGPPSATVTLIEFADFQGPFSQRFWAQTLPLIKQNYIDTERINYVFRDFPLSFFQFDQTASEASECADEQGLYWLYHDYLFGNQNDWVSSSNLTEAISKFKQYAQILGLNSSQFDFCLDSGQMTSEVQQDFADGQAAGVSGTPTFFVQSVCGEEQKIVGAQSYSVFETALNSFVQNCPLTDPPVLDPIGNKQVNENETLVIDVNATDPDNDTLTYYTNANDTLPSPFSFDSSTGLFEWTPTFDDAGNYSVTFNVTDSELWDNETITITVNNVNRPPVLELISDKVVNETDVVVIVANANDPDGDQITYFINDSRFNKFGSNVFIWDTQEGDAGNYSVLITASDGELNATQIVGILVIKPFVCGDMNADGNVDISDLTYLVNWMFQGGPPPVSLEAADVNNDGQNDISDLTYLVDYMFGGGPSPVCSDGLIRKGIVGIANAD